MMHSTNVALYSVMPTGTETQKTCAWSESAAHFSQIKHTGGGQGRATVRQRRGLEEGRVGQRERGQEK